MHLIEIAFKGNRKEFFRWEGEEPPPLRASVVVEADRGEDLGVVHATGELAAKRCTGCAHGLGATEPTRKALRVASTRDVRQAQEIRSQDDSARQKATERVKAHGLVMKVSDAEWQWDRKKLTFYFTADRRVDFRDLVRDLAALFRARIELKQIGVRDEAKRLDGIGRCGRQFCSASWLPELRPVNLGVAKDQHLSLNPSQISGACGRLMCCLRYEHEMYVQSRKRFPKEGKTLIAARGEEKVIANEIFNERVTLRSAEGEMRVISLSQLRRELAAAGQPLPDLEPTRADPDEATSEFAAEMGLDEEIEERDIAANAVRYDPETDLPRESDAERPEQRRSESTARRPAGRSERDERAERRDGPGAGERPEQGEPASRARRPRTRSSRSASSPKAQGEQPPAEPVAAERGEGTPGPRRRRGRRGGRRGRGKGPANGASGTDASPRTSDDARSGQSDREPPAGGGSAGSGES